MAVRRISFALLLGVAAHAAERIDLIEFFGYQGVSADAVRKALPVQEGGAYDDKTGVRIRAEVKRLTGAEPTDIAPVCCINRGHSVLFIGLPGTSSRQFPLNPKPDGAARLSKEFLAIYAKLDHAFEAAVKKGGDAPLEDDSQGYALIHDPAARALQLQLRDYTRSHEAEIYLAAETSSDAGQRSQAADAIGYAARTPQQLAALVRASHDVNADVRDEATRAIGVLLRADPSVAAQLPAADFIEMASSGVWMDRNKASMVLDELTFSRDPKLLAEIEASAWTALLEMARWRDTSHASMPRRILGRIRGIPEDRLSVLAFGTPAAFLTAIGAK